MTTIFNAAKTFATWGTLGPTGDRVKSVLLTTPANTHTCVADGTITAVGIKLRSIIPTPGGTVNVGIYNITADTSGHNGVLLAQASIPIHVDSTNNPGGDEYTFYSAVTSISVTSGMVIAIGHGVPTVDIVSEVYSPTCIAISGNTAVLPGTFAENDGGYSAEMYATLVDSTPVIIDCGDSGSNVLRASRTESINCSLFSTLTSGSLDGGIALAAISAPVGVGTITLPTLVDSSAIGLFGSRTLTVSDGTNSDSIAVTFLPISTTAYPPVNQSYVTLAGTLDTSINSCLYNLSPAAVAGDQIVYETSTFTPIGTDGKFSTDLSGTQTLWHIKASTGVARSFTLTTDASGGSDLTVTLTGVSSTANVGTITPSLGSVSDISVNLTGVAATANVGNITPSLGGSPLSVNLTGVNATANTGTIVASLTAYVANTLSDNLPRFLVDSVKKLRKTFRKSFRKK